MRLIWMQLRTYSYEYEIRSVASLAAGSAAFSELCPSGIQGFSQSSDLSSLGLGEKDANVLSPAVVLSGLLLCQFDQIDSKAFVRMNQLLFCSSILAAVMLTRFITSSWMLSLIVAAMLFSRGMLLADIGSVSASYLIMFCLLAGCTCFTHFLRSGSRHMAVAGTAAFSFICLIDRSLWFLCLIPVGLLLFGWLLTRNLIASRSNDKISTVRTADLSSLRHSYQGDFSSQFARLAGTFRWFFGMEFGNARDHQGGAEHGEVVGRQESRGGLFSVLNADFYEWLFASKRWLKLGLLLVLGMLVGLTLDFAITRLMTGRYPTGFITHLFPISETLAVINTHSQSFIWSQLSRVDMHLIVSFFITALCAVQHPKAGLTGFFELAALVLFLCVTIALMSTLSDAAEYRWALDHYKFSSAKPLESVYGVRGWMQWLEPLILTMGIAGFYNLMKVLDTRISGKTN